MLYLKENHRELTSVIFDLGNVLLDYDPRRFMFELGMDPKVFDPLLKLFFEDMKAEWDALDRNVISTEEFIAVAADREPMYRKEIGFYMRNWKKQFHAIPENVAAMYAAKEAGAKVYVLSNFMKDTFDYIWPHNQFFDDFDGILFSFETRLSKPNPAIYQLLLDMFPIDPEKCVFFDDLQVNVDAANASGLYAVRIEPRSPILPLLEIE